MLFSDAYIKVYTYSAKIRKRRKERERDISLARFFVREEPSRLTATTFLDEILRNSASFIAHRRSQISLLK